jgi:hypothetical protein
VKKKKKKKSKLVLMFGIVVAFVVVIWKKKSNFIKITFSWSFFIYKLKCLVKTIIEIDVEK